MKRSFTDKVLHWYEQHKRDLPWRHTKDPYKIWLSEIILQQTRVAQGMSYYWKFIEAFPSLSDLASASEEQVLKLWQGLGYYSRARYLLSTARFVQNKRNGQFPDTYTELIKLKGVGDYTASAIASLCFDRVTPTIDGNVYRVLARYFGIKTPINTTKAQKEFKALAMKLIPPDTPGLFNQAMIEFGALQCTPSSPDCTTCPVENTCFALEKKQIKTLPHKEKKIKISKRYFNYLVLQTSEGNTMVQQRTQKDIWQNLWEFPLIESNTDIGYKRLLQDERFIKFIGKQGFTLKLLHLKSIIHKLSHQHLYIKFWLVEMAFSNNGMYSWDRVLALPMPIIIHKFVKNYGFKSKICNFEKQNHLHLNITKNE